MTSKISCVEATSVKDDTLPVSATVDTFKKENHLHKLNLKYRRLKTKELYKGGKQLDPGVKQVVGNIYSQVLLHNPAMKDEDIEKRVADLTGISISNIRRIKTELKSSSSGQLQCDM